MFNNRSLIKIHVLKKLYNFKPNYTSKIYLYIQLDLNDDFHQIATGSLTWATPKIIFSMSIQNKKCLSLSVNLSHCLSRHTIFNSQLFSSNVDGI